MTTEPRTSIVVPCYDGAPFVADALSRLLSALDACEPARPFEVVFVDDGSTDDTAAIVAERFPRVSLIRHDRNRGKGAAVRTGVRAARGRFVFFVDADIPFDLSILPVMIDYLDRKEFDVCIGSRTRLPDDHPARRHVVRRIASAVFTEFVSRIVVTGVRDTQCGLKGLRREAARYLFEQGRVDNFAFDVELLYLAYKNDLDVKKVPVRLVADDHSSVSPLRHGPGMLIEILKLPVRWYSGGYERMPGRHPEWAP